MSYASAWPVFEWLRKKLKVDKPEYLGWGEWDEWDANFKKTRPVAFFLTESVPEAIDWLDEQTLERLDHVRAYYVNRFVTKSHILPTGLEKGRSYSVDDRLLHGVFGALIDFVEVECASMHLAFTDDKNEFKRFKYPWWRKAWITRWNTWRCPEAGIAYLYGHMALDDPENAHRFAPQAAQARETFELYYWWKHVRPYRPSVEEASGMTAFEEEMKGKYKKEDVDLFSRDLYSADEKARVNTIMAALSTIEDERAEEDNDMLVRLITHRSHLWT